MILDMYAHQQAKFERLARKIVADPAAYIDFDSVSDVYKAPWLKDFPQGTQLYVSGLDDGAEQFDIRLEYRNAYLTMSSIAPFHAKFGFILAPLEQYSQ